MRMDATVGEVVPDLKVLAPVGQREGFASVLKPQRITPIPYLLGTCSPVAVGWFVVSVWVLSLYGMTCCWARTHVFEELRESAPARTYPDSSPTIQVIAAMRLVTATATHGLPRGVLRLGLGHAMRAQPRTANLIVEAAAASSSSSDQRRADYDEFLAAVTAADPPSFASGRALFVPTKNLETSETSSVQGDRSYHLRLIMPHKSSVVNGASFLSYSDT